MTLAHRLQSAGQDVTILERADHLGGMADAWEFGPYVWDRHYHVTLLSDLHLRGLLRELSLEEDMVWKETKTGFYTDGSWYSMSNSLEFLRFPPLHLLDKFRLGATIFYASKLKDWKRLEGIPVADWLTRLSGERVFEKMWLPLLKAKLGESYTKTSAAFIWAIIARMYAARQSGLKKEMFGYLTGGYDRFLTTFSRRLEEDGVTIQCGSTVQEIRKTDRGFCIMAANEEEKTFDQVVTTMPSPLAASTCIDLTPIEREQLREVEYQGIVCASVLLKKPVQGYYVTNITDTWVPFTAIIEMTSLVDPENFGGNTLVYLPKYVSPDDPLFDEDDASIKERFIEALLAMNPHLRPDDVLSFQVSRERRVLALSTLNYSSRLAPMKSSVEGLFIVNSSQIYQGTLNVNETIQLAHRAMDEVLLPEQNDSA